MSWRGLVLAVTTMLAVVVVAVLVLTRSSFREPSGCDSVGGSALLAGSAYLSARLPDLKVGAYFDGNCDSGDPASIDLHHPNYSYMQAFLSAQGCRTMDIDGEYSTVRCDLNGHPFEVDHRDVNGGLEGELYLARQR